MRADAPLDLLRAALHGDEEMVAASLAVHPGAARESLHLACALADVEAAAASSEPAGRKSGPLDATPLVYVCASRFQRGDRDCARHRVRIARLLVERGADPDASYRDLEHFDGERSAVSAVALHVGSADLLRTLIEAGAREHDHSALWAATTSDAGVDDDPLAALRYLLSRHPPRWSLDFALVLAVRRDDPEAVALLLEAGASADAGGGWGGSGTLLHLAVLQGSAPSIRDALFERGDLERRDRDGRRPLDVAQRIGDGAAVRSLRERGSPPSDPTATDGALAAAITGDGHAGPPPRPLALTRGDHQLLIWAVENRPAAVVARLLELGLDPGVVGDDGRSALAVAREAGARESAALLAAAGGRHESFAAHVVPDPHAEAFESAAQAVVDGDLRALEGLIDAQPELVRWRSPRPHRATLLHYLGANGVETYRQKTPPNARQVLALLLDRGAEPDALAATYGGGPAQTTLALLASSGWPAAAGLQRPLVVDLCRGGARPDGIDADGLPLATAIAFHCEAAMEGLVEAGARVDDVLLAAALGRTDVIERDVVAGRLRPDAPRCRVDWLAPRGDGRWLAERALVLAADFGRLSAVDALLERGVPASCAPHEGQTPLHGACYRGHEAVVRRLLEAGADPRARDSRYQSTCLGWAREGRRERVQEILRAHDPPRRH